MPKRAKVRLEFPEKLFYENLLVDWKESVPDKNHACVIRNALDNLRRFPININGYAELRQIKGIGESIATRLDAAWKSACGAFFQTDMPSVDQVRTLSRGEFMQFLETAVVSKGKHDAVPFIPRKRVAGTSSQATDVPTITHTCSQLIKSTTNNVDDNFPGYSSDLLNVSHSQPTSSFASLYNQPPAKVQRSIAIDSVSIVDIPRVGTSQPEMNDIVTAPATKAPFVVQAITDSSMSTQSCDLSQSSLLVYDPVNVAQYELLLIVDGRENTGGRGRANHRATITQHLDKLGVRYELRPLSVGDYLWVARRIGSVSNHYDEMVMDYVVERKTWDDLKRSIRETRYSEQKRRLCESGIRNVVLVAEGQPTSDRSLEQALASTSVDNKFLVHRTLSLQGTARFLKTLTDRLTQRMKIEHICGPSFAALQDNSRKTKMLTVKDCWLRQLTVCPLMSSEKAKMLVDHFPSLRSLTNFYRQKAEEINTDEEWRMLLHKEINDVPKALSAQLSLFFKK